MDGSEAGSMTGHATSGQGGAFCEAVSRYAPRPPLGCFPRLGMRASAFPASVRAG